MAVKNVTLLCDGQVCYRCSFFEFKQPIKTVYFCVASVNLPRVATPDQKK